MRVFISHSSKDTELTKKLIELIRASLNLPSEDIRCTSMEGYRLPAGADTDATIRAEVEDAAVFLAVLSEASLSSLYVTFELGARWGTQKPFFPLLYPGQNPNIISRPLSNLNVLRCDNEGDLHQLVSEMGKLLHIKPQPPAGYQQYINDISQLQSTSQFAMDNKAKTERPIYDSSNRELGFDFRGSAAKIWENIDGKDQPISDYGKGELTFESGGIINIKRFNTEGRFEVWLQTYFFGGTETTAIPKDDLMPGYRRLRISCEAKAAGAEHTLRFILRNEKTNKWVANAKWTITSNTWTPIKIYFQIPPNEECRLRIDDMDVTSAPSSVQICKFLLSERMS